MPSKRFKLDAGSALTAPVTPLFTKRSSLNELKTKKNFYISFEDCIERPDVKLELPTKSVQSSEISTE